MFDFLQSFGNAACLTDLLLYGSIRVSGMEPLLKGVSHHESVTRLPQEPNPTVFLLPSVSAATGVNPLLQFSFLHTATAVQHLHKNQQSHLWLQTWFTPDCQKARVSGFGSSALTPLGWCLEFRRRLWFRFNFLIFFLDVILYLKILYLRILYFRILWIEIK